jgi:CheY-like chemotaxis protein
MRANVIDLSIFLARRYRMSGQRVLVVDDEEDVAFYFSNLLEDHGFIPSCAFSAEEALRYIETDPPDLILLDIMMPGRGGLNLFARLKKDEPYKDIPVVIVTGIRNKMGGDFSFFVENLKARVPEGYIEKPIDPGHFIQTIYKAMNKAPS